MAAVPIESVDMAAAEAMPGGWETQWATIYGKVADGKHKTVVRLLATKSL